MAQGAVARRGAAVGAAGLERAGAAVDQGTHLSLFERQHRHGQEGDQIGQPGQLSVSEGIEAGGAERGGLHLASGRGLAGGAGGADRGGDPGDVGRRASRDSARGDDGRIGHPQGGRRNRAVLGGWLEGIGAVSVRRGGGVRERGGRAGGGGKAGAGDPIFQA